MLIQPKKSAGEPNPNTGEPTCQMTPDNAWRPISQAPQDGTEIIVYCPPAHGLHHMASICAYNEYAGFCVDELRTPTLWLPLPTLFGLTTQPATIQTIV